MKLLDGAAYEHPRHVYVSYTGNDFLPDVLETGRTAVAVLAKAGIMSTLAVVNDVCVTPFHGVGAMRNHSIINGLEANATHVLIIDNDIRVDDPKAFLKLVEADKLVVSAWFDQTPCETEPGVWQVLQNPTLEPHQGLVPIKWVAVNCVMFNLCIFRMLGPRLFTDPMITNEEEYIFSYLRYYGVELWQHTDAVVQMLRPPTKIWEIVPNGRLMNNPIEKVIKL